jgi:hypothetical protein
MKKFMIGWIVGTTLSLVVVVIGYDYAQTKARVSNIENFLKQAVQQGQQQQQARPPAVKDKG